ncbi:MAG: response regulator transcription factor [Deltaproteobacteria bacterium]|jgi:DNA-binding response OmpR family regulator|nr:response regulator transcription factor [Deltaproteobacteria bacterium]
MKTDKKKILLIEDSPALLAGLLSNLQYEGYWVTAAPQGKLGLKQLDESRFDLIILDLMLPDIDGFDLLEKIRKKGDYTPVLILSARDGVDNKVKGLQTGADDYLTKPFELEELLARVAAIIRRKHGLTKSVKFGDVKVHLEERKVTREGEPVHLTPREFNLLQWFINNPNRVFSRRELIENIWKDQPEATRRTVDNFVMSLRKKLDRSGKHKFFITVRGHGYRFDL